LAWLRLDDRFTKHPKVLQLKRADRWAWLEILEYCAAYQTGGHIPNAIQDVVPHATPALVEKCVQAGLLDRFPTGSPGSQNGYQVHDWLDYNPPRIDETHLEQRVADALADYPDASANDVHRMVGGRKQAVLDLVRRFRNGSHPVPERFPPPVPGTSPEPVTRAAARARPVPNPITTTSSSVVVAREDDEQLNQTLNGIHLTGPARTAALELQATNPERLQACVTASLTATRPAAYLAELIRNGSHPQPPQPEPHAPDPTTVCADCGERLGHGHLETCPRLAAVPAEPEPGEPRVIEPPPPELLATVGLATDPSPDDDPEPELDPEPRVGGAA